MLALLGIGLPLIVILTSSFQSDKRISLAIDEMEFKTQQLTKNINDSLKEMEDRFKEMEVRFRELAEGISKKPELTAYVDDHALLKSKIVFKAPHETKRLVIINEDSIKRRTNTLISF